MFKKYVYMICMAPVILLFTPFFFLGVTVGQFVGATFFGYKTGRELMLEMTGKFTKWAQVKK